jgi:glycosyltransferase involved in cell wall biosynthesis
MKSQRMARDVVVIPAYNEAGTIRGLAQRALEACPDVVVVDDGSTDGTARELEGVAVTVLRHSRNLGKAAALWKGFEHARELGATRVVTLDGDGQHSPEDIARLLRASDRHPGRIVIGARLHDRKNFPKRRYYANQFARFWISWAAGYPIADTQSGFRVYPCELLEGLGQRGVSWGRFVFESEVLIAAGALGVHSVAVPIPGIYPQFARASHFRPVMDIAQIVLMVGANLLRRGMYPAGLWRCLNLPVHIERVAEARTRTADGGE